VNWAISPAATTCRPARSLTARRRALAGTHTEDDVQELGTHLADDADVVDAVAVDVADGRTVIVP
jgi:hypothetical protein